MKNFNELSHDNQIEIIDLIENWLKNYTHEVIIKVMKKREEIINNKFAISLLRELYNRETEERKEFNRRIKALLENFEEFKKFNVHNNCLSHSKSYRDVLYDMYIKEY